MSILRELNELLTPILPVETGVFSGISIDFARVGGSAVEQVQTSDIVPDEYIVITPLAEVFEVHADNAPLHETQEARLSLFSKRNYQQIKNQIVKALLAADITVTDRRYIGYEADTQYHHYAIDVAKNYNMEPA